MKTWFLPPGTPEPKSLPDAGGLQIPDFSPGEAQGIARRLKGGQRELIKLRNEVLFRAMDEAVAEWLEPGCAARRTAESAFRDISGLAAATAPFSAVLEICAGPDFRKWARAEVQPLEALEKFVPGPDGAPVRALGPALALHVLPGNVPLIWLPAFLACIFMRTPCLLKPSHEDPLSPALFCRTLADKLPALAAALGVVPWRGGELDLETEILQQSEALIVYGGEEAVYSLAGRLSSDAKLIAHGPRSAAGVIAREASGPGRLENAAAGAARDALLYDGRGCLSLSTIYIEQGGLYAPQESAAIIAQALAAAASALPAGRLDPDSAALQRSWRGRLQARALAGKPGQLWADPNRLDWACFYDREMIPPETPLRRAIWVSPIPDIQELNGRLAACRGRLHALAFAGPEARRAALAEMLAPLGLTRLTSFGSLQTPPLSWPHGGSSPFRRLLSWTRVER